MNRIIAVFKKVRLRQILMTFVAGALLLVSTACNNGGNTGGPATRQNVPAGLQSEGGAQAKNNNPRPEVPGGTATSPSGDVINRFQGGSMNEFSDVDPRAQKAAGAAADKAAALKENAERNVIDQTSDVGENTRRILDKKGENVDQIGRNLNKSTEEAKNRAQSTADNLSNATKQGIENVKDTTKDAANSLTSGANRAAENVKGSTREAANDVTRGINRAAENVKDNTRDTAYDVNRGINRAADNVKANAPDTGNGLVDSFQQAIENTGEFVQSRLNQAGNAAQNTVDKTAQSTVTKAGNAIKDATDIK